MGPSSTPVGPEIVRTGVPRVVTVAPPGLPLAATRRPYSPATSTMMPPATVIGATVWRVSLATPNVPSPLGNRYVTVRDWVVARGFPTETLVPSRGVVMLPSG